MALKYPSVKSTSFGIFLIFVSLLIIFLAIILPWYTGNIHSIYEFLISILFASIIPSFALWIWLGTYYIIDNEVLITRSGPMIFKIPVGQISVIRLNQKTIGGLWKPTTSWNSIQIEYNKFDSVFISPVNQEEFITELLKINPRIGLKQN
jgi:hypothetical protein